jgi:hypothetical protein
MEFKIPEPLKIEHDALHAELARATKEAGEIGQAARKVAEMLHPHFVKEEEYALPPLGLLGAIAQGQFSAEMNSVLGLTDRLKRELPEMLAEHQGIVAALETLSSSARKHNRQEYARFAEKLMLHARTEEEVLYPAAILIGEYVRLKGS